MNGPRCYWLLRLLLAVVRLLLMAHLSLLDMLLEVGTIRSQAVGAIVQLLWTMHAQLTANAICIWPLVPLTANAIWPLVTIVLQSPERAAGTACR